MSVNGQQQFTALISHLQLECCDSLYFKSLYGVVQKKDVRNNTLSHLKYVFVSLFKLHV